MRVNRAPLIPHRLLAKLLAGLLSLWFCLPAGAAALPDFTAYYTAYKGSFSMAKARISLKHADGQYVYTSFTKPAGLLALFRSDTITERSAWVYHDKHIRPLNYQYRLDGRKNKFVQLVFHWDRHQVVNTAEGHTWTMDIPDGTLDKFSVQLAVRLDLQRGRHKLDYDIADGGKLKSYKFAILGTERVTTPAGQFDAVKIIRERKNNRRKTYMWCAPELDYLLVRIEHVEKDGSHYYMSLDKVEGMKKSAARGETPEAGRSPSRPARLAQISRRAAQ